MDVGIQRSRVATTRLDEASEVMCRTFAGFRIPDAEEPPGFRFSQHAVTGPQFAVTTMQWNGRVRAEADLRGMVTVGHQLRGDLQLRQEHRTLDTTRPFLYPTGALEGSWSRFDVALIGLAPDALQRFATERSGDPAPVVFTGTTAIDPDRELLWTNAAKHVLRDILPNEAALHSDIVRGEAFRGLAAALLTAFPNTWLDRHQQAERGAERSSGGVRRAVDYLHANASRDISIAEVAEAARLSPRGLHAAFRRELDVTPLDYLRGLRLDATFCELRTAEPGDGTTVAAVALRWGFSNAGRFASAYRTRFGETPAATLRS